MTVGIHLFLIVLSELIAHSSILLDPGIGYGVKLIVSLHSDVVLRSPTLFFRIDHR
jgi:hypothetical protein